MVVVPLEGAGENLKLTIRSQIQVRGVAKVAAKRALDSANITMKFSKNSDSS